MNLFTVSSYAPYANTSVVEEVTRIRLGEDEALLQALGGDVHLLDLGLMDAPLRLGFEDERRVLATLSEHQLEQQVESLAQTLTAAVDTGQLGHLNMFLLPMGLGGHVDHRIARDAGARALPPSRTGFYEDLPYAARLGPDQRAAFDAEPGLPALESVTLMLEGGAADKTNLASLYKSQISPDVAEEIGAYAYDLGDGERLLMSAALFNDLKRAVHLDETANEGDLH